MKNNIRQHAIHTAIVFVVLLVGGLVLPQFYHFSNLGATFLVTAAYMAVYFVFERMFGYVATKMNTMIDGWAFILFLVTDFIPGAIALNLMANLYAGFWACTPWLVAAILSVIIELLYMLGAYIQER